MQIETMKRSFMLALFYKLIRPLFVRDADLNEDYECIVCGKPVLHRRLYCSRRCFDAGRDERAAAEPT
jgi:hypothetical protein